jgi:tetratricopeptide (TPR) repeat protein
MELDGAEKCFQLALRIDDTNTTTWRNYSALCTQLNRMDEAIALEKKALQTRKFKLCTVRI